MKNKTTDITLQEHVEVVECKHRMSVSGICNKFGTEKTQVYTIFTKKDSIIDQCLKGNSLHIIQKPTTNGNEKINSYM